MRSYNTEQVPIRNENAEKIQKKVRGNQARKNVEEMKKNMKTDNLALATLKQGVKSFQNIPVQRELKKMLGLKLNGGSRRQRTHKRKQNKRKTLHKRKTHKRKTYKRKTHKKRRH
tara:strand:- start:197 stop:541 length:345 start_codon:yes stop_codon:yes gene_type:complete